MITLEKVSITVNGRTLIDEATATLPHGTVTHLTGANGSGKTSLIRAIAGLQRHTGRIHLDARDSSTGDGGTTDHPVVTRGHPRLYACFDDAPVFPFLTGYENLAQLLGRRVARAEADRALRGLLGRDQLRHRARRLSHGQRKRLHLGAALLSGADYLLLDEALAGVDAPTTDEVGTLLACRTPGTTVLLTGHLDDAATRLATQRLVIREGRLVAEEAA